MRVHSRSQTGVARERRARRSSTRLRALWLSVYPLPASSLIEMDNWTASINKSRIALVELQYSSAARAPHRTIHPLLRTVTRTFVDTLLTVRLARPRLIGGGRSAVVIAGGGPACSLFVYHPWFIALCEHGCDEEVTPPQPSARRLDGFFLFADMGSEHRSDFILAPLSR